MKKSSSLRAVLAVVLVQAALCSAAAVAADKPGRAEVEAFIAIATVQEVNQKTRQVTLRDPEGNMTTFIAGEEVANLPQVKKGDVVLMEYYQGLAIAVGPKGTGLEGRRDEVEAEAGVPGEKPALTVTRTVDALLKLKALDREARVATLEGPEQTVRLKVRDDVDLDAVKVGDEVRVSYIASLAIRFVPAPKVSGTVTGHSTSVAVGIGVAWGEGELVMYDGSKHKLKVGGISLVDVGVSKAQFSGEVYELTDPKDIQGTYSAASAALTLVKGHSAAVMKNDRGVVIRVVSEQTGVKLALAADGIKIELAE